MQIQVNTDNNIPGNAATTARVNDAVKDALGRVSAQITRVEVHLSDVNGDKHGTDDQRCMMEARLEGRQPVAVTHQAATMDLAVDGAADKLAQLIDSTLERQRDQQRRRMGPPQFGTGST